MDYWFRARPVPRKCSRLNKIAPKVVQNDPNNCPKVSQKLQKSIVHMDYWFRARPAPPKWPKLETIDGQVTKMVALALQRFHYCALLNILFMFRATLSLFLVRLCGTSVNFWQLRGPIAVRQATQRHLRLGEYAPKWIQVNTNETKWIQVIPSESTWDQVKPSETKKHGWIMDPKTSFCWTWI